MIEKFQILVKEMC